MNEDTDDLRALSLVKDPVTRLLIAHDAHLARLDSYFRFGVVMCSIGSTLLAAILLALLTR